MNSSDDPPSLSIAVGDDFDSFFRREYPAMVSLAAAVSGRRDVAEDLAQEAFTKAHRRWNRIARYDRPGAWVRRVTINLAISHKRRAATETRTRLRLVGERRTQPPASTPGIPGGDNEVWAAVADLPGNQRAAVALHYLEDRSIAEIADILDCAPATARVHLHRGRSKLAEVLAHHRQPPPSPAERPSS